MNDLEIDLFRMASDDADARELLAVALDAAEDHMEPLLNLMRPHCFTPTTIVELASIDVLCGELADQIAEWVKAGEAEAPTWAKEVLFDLFKLRNGVPPCVDCMAYATELGQLHPRESGIWCDAHRPLTVHDLFGGGRPLALVRNVA